MTDLPHLFSRELALACWKRATLSEHGIAIPVDPAYLDTIRVEMYRARREANDPEMEKFMLVQGPENREIWLVRKTVEID